jgi:hypothetical protein
MENELNITELKDAIQGFRDCKLQPLLKELERLEERRDEVEGRIQELRDELQPLLDKLAGLETT